jgi:phosphoserine phosphatase
LLRLAVFDLDGTLKRERDPYVYLHRHLGTQEKSDRFTARGLSGEIPYEEWLRLDVGLWVGTPRAALEKLMRANPYLPGARETVAALRERGVQVAIISTGPLFHAEMVAAELGIRSILGNEVIFAGNSGEAMVNGEVRAHVCFYEKGPALERLQRELGVLPEECIAVGDGVTDIPMFQRVAVGIAVAPGKPEVAAAAHIVLPEPDLRPLLTRLHLLTPALW